MEIRQLEYLLADSSEGSFTKAAARLGVAQSAVSHQVAKLEDELGMQSGLRRCRVAPGS
ncbi:LysR family transcriptional regulator [Streptomyces sp. NPDC017964]|uniref:LysR family transcriptional regulator n=1 Tax=Streptomyces sp. NPDC017964 TaxID=3365022 RepID=UPI0037A84183